MDAPSTPVADLDARFDEHYLYFYSTAFTPERSDHEAALIAQVLELAPAMTVLDVPCGYGRIANRLAARGCRVTGLDANPRFLEYARQEAAGQQADVEYVAGDMRQLPWQGRFDRLVCWFISFGYFDDATDRQVLAGFRRALRPGGRLLLDHVNLAHQVRVLPAPPSPSATLGPAMGFLVDRGEEFFIMRTSFNLLTSRIEYERLVARGGAISRHRFSVRAFTVPELRDWLLQAGFAQVEVYGGAGSPLTLDSFRMLVVAHA